MPLLRFVTGIAMAGVYPVGMKLASTWADGDMGLMVGILVGALTLGSACRTCSTRSAASTGASRSRVASVSRARGRAADRLRAASGPTARRRRASIRARC